MNNYMKKINLYSIKYKKTTLMSLYLFYKTLFLPDRYSYSLFKSSVIIDVSLEKCTTARNILDRDEQR